MHRTSVGRFVTWVAGLVGLSIVAGVPLGFWTLQYRGTMSTLASEARTQAAMVSDFVGRNPSMWSYAPDRLSAVVHSIRDPLQRTRIVDNAGQLVLEFPVALEWPTV